MWDPLRPKYTKKYKKPKYLATKKQRNKKNIHKRLGRGTCTLSTCAKNQGLSKTARTLDSEGISGFMLEPACRPNEPKTGQK